MTSLEGQTALVTGANKGIGREIARQLGRMGATVLIGARDAGRGEAAATELTGDGVDARFVQLDVTDAGSIAAAARTIADDHGKLDILINNAGIFIDDGPPSGVGMDTIKRTYETNFFGVVAVTQAMLPLIHQAEAGRIVNMSSGLGSIAQNSDPDYDYYQANLLAYNSSKAALNAATVTLAKELANTPIKVNAADPGYVATDINGNQGPHTVEQGARAPVRLATLPADGPTGQFLDEDGPVPW